MFILLHLTSQVIMRTAVLLLCLAVYCAAQTPTPCKSPEQFEGRFYRNDRAKSYTDFGKVSYDETNKRIRIIEERELGSDRSYYDSLYLHNIGRQYILDLKTRKCNVSAISERFMPFGVPPFAKFVFEAEVGAAGVPGESLIAQTFEGTFENGIKFTATATFPDCVPITNGYYGTDLGYVVSDFFDVNLGISDPTVFIPPTECNM